MTILAIVAVVTSAMPFGAVLAGSMGLISLWALTRLYRTVKGSTLVAPWCWSVAAVAAVSISEVIVQWPGELQSAAWTGHVRYLAAAVTFCPIMAVLGAKRPQDRAWQLIVLSLWVIVALPVGSALLYWPGQALILHPAWQWFLVVLIGVALFNYLPTRFWPSSVFVCAAQISLFADHLPLPALPGAPLTRWIGMACGTAAILLCAFGLPARQSVREPIDRLWLDFRDRYGALWALRVAERFNDAAKRNGWGVRLTWAGLSNATQQPTAAEPISDNGARVIQSDEVASAMRTSLQGLLRRFLPQRSIDDIKVATKN